MGYLKENLEEAKKCLERAEGYIYSNLQTESASNIVPIRICLELLQQILESDNDGN